MHFTVVIPFVMIFFQKQNHETFILLFVQDIFFADFPAWIYTCLAIFGVMENNFGVAQHHNIFLTNLRIYVDAKPIHAHIEVIKLWFYNHARRSNIKRR